jgi:AcrR family transcriptional regulator
MIAAARQLLVEGGPGAITVDAVSARSGVAKSTFYRHWQTRDEMVVDVFNSLAPPVIVVDASLSPTDALREFGRRLAATMSDPEWQCMTPALLQLKIHEPNFAHVEERIQSDQRGALNAILQRGIDEGTFRADATSDTSFALFFGPFLLASLLDLTALDQAFADAVIDQFVGGHRPSA